MSKSFKVGDFVRTKKTLSPFKTYGKLTFYHAMKIDNDFPEKIVYISNMTGSVRCGNGFFYSTDMLMKAKK